jgi:hypothetical protein
VRGESTREGWAPYARERRRIHDDGARVRVRLEGMRGSLEVPGMRLERAV